jgi:ATP-dependent Lhr-like helicase
MEERGQVRRGYFVTGLGAAQFALPGAVDRLRDLRRTRTGERPGGSGSNGESDDDIDDRFDRFDPFDDAGDGDDGGAPILTLAAVDPGQPYGAALPWPDIDGGHPARTAGAYVVSRDGRPLVYLHRGGRSLVAFEGAADDSAWVGELGRLVDNRRVRSLEIQKINGQPTSEHPDLQELLLAGGFRSGYKGPTYRR